MIAPSVDTVFETSRLVVRRYTEDDKENFFRLSGNEEVMRYIRPVSTKEQSDIYLSEYIAAYREFPGRGRWAVNEKGSGLFAGSFAIIPIPSMPGKLQLGYSLLPEMWGKGYATELTKNGLGYFFQTSELKIIYGVTEIPNIASQKVLLKAGFKEAGSFTEEGKELLLFEYAKQ
jgi:[ribosomal protein S5]-alanine N-acetyltransferase